MITNLIINVFVLFVGAVFSLLPQITTLPTIAGFDIDSALVSGVGQMRAFFVAFWPLAILMQGFAALMAYFILKMGLKFLFGSRAPGHD